MESKTNNESNTRERAFTQTPPVAVSFPTSPVPSRSVPSRSKPSSRPGYILLPQPRYPPQLPNAQKSPNVPGISD
ncbi:hypothetical protein PZA11_007574 [Diplocarpon coronariae]